MPGYRKLGRPSAHRKSMLRNLVTDLFREERIQTTDCRAKEARRETDYFGKTRRSSRKKTGISISFR